MLPLDRVMTPTPVGFPFPMTGLSADPPAAFGRNSSVTTCGGKWGDTHSTLRKKRRGMGGKLLVGYWAKISGHGDWWITVGVGWGRACVRL